jgi:tetratricopeptide (TPR) repeat protein
MPAVLLLIFVVFLPLSPMVAGSAEGAASGRLETVDRLLARGAVTDAWRLLDDMGAGYPRAEILWRRARARYQWAQDAPATERLEQFRGAEKLARRAIAANPRNAEGYKWLAIALGARAGEMGSVDSIKLAGEIQTAISRALAIDPDDDVSLLVLGLWHYKIARHNPFLHTLARVVGDLPPASLDEAENLLRRAIAIHDRIMHRYYLARVCEKRGKRYEAIRHLERALELPVSFPGEARKMAKIRRKLSRWRATAAAPVDSGDGGLRSAAESPPG